MFISVKDIKTVPGKIISFRLAEDFPSAKLGYKLIKPVIFTGEAENKGEYILIEGEIQTAIQTECAACLKPVEFAVSALFKEAYALNQDLFDENGELDIHSFSGDLICADEEIAASILFSLPMRILCREDCRGLCPYCGADLNVCECNCAKEQIDPRLAVLKNLKFDYSDKEV